MVNNKKQHFVHYNISLLILKHNKKLKYFCDIKSLWPAALAGNVTAGDGFVAVFYVHSVAGFHLDDGTAGIVVEFAGVPVPDISEDGGAYQD